MWISWRHRHLGIFETIVGWNEQGRIDGGMLVFAVVGSAAAGVVAVDRCGDIIVQNPKGRLHAVKIPRVGDAGFGIGVVIDEVKLRPSADQAILPVLSPGAELRPEGSGSDEPIVTKNSHRKVYPPTFLLGGREIKGFAGV